MKEIIELDSNYSTTRRVIKTDPQQMAEEVKQTNKLEDKFETVLFLPEGEARQGEGGLRTRGYFKKTSEGQPLITVVTVVYNGEKFLEETILSIINQTYDNVEYIIIDGGSADGTLDIIRKYEHAIDYWVSEKDQGIYDAMNKGIDLATGDWINFMNGGDLFFNSNIIRTIQGFNDYDLIYGRVAIYKEIIEKYEIPTTKKFGNKRNLPYCHQSLFLQKNKYKTHKFNTRYAIASDYDQYLSLIKNNVFYKELDEPLTFFLSNGVSDTDRNDLLKEYFFIQKESSLFLAYFFLLYRRIKLILKDCL